MVLGTDEWGTNPARGNGRLDGSDEGDASVDFFRAIGRQVRVLRERAGLTRRELADRLGYAEEHICSMEDDGRALQPEFLDAADELLAAGGLLRATKDDVLRARTRVRVRHPTWFREFARLEAEAVELRYYSNHTFPGLLQTEEYIRALLTRRKPLLDDELIEQRAAARLARQEVLHRQPAPTISAVVEESVLRRPLGGDEVRRCQLRRLAGLVADAAIELQIMPLEQGDHTGMDGPFVLLTRKNRQVVAYVEVQGVGRLITDAEEVRVLALRYGSLRAQALTTQASSYLIETMLGER